jgi:tRNA wybutosine-synthesizing protein 3
MSFELEKKNSLEKIDKSRKGAIDQPIKKILDLVNKKPNYYTTSSCSGRIILLETAPKGKRHQAKWLLIKHDKAVLKDVQNALAKTTLAKAKKDVWFKQEGAILHVACKTGKDAERMLKAVRNAGFKRAGIISTKRNIIEVMSTENIAAPIAKKGKIIVNEGYLKELILTANQLMAVNAKRLAKLKYILKSI